MFEVFAALCSLLCFLMFCDYLRRKAQCVELGARLLELEAQGAELQAQGAELEAQGVQLQAYHAVPKQKKNVHRMLPGIETERPTA